MKQTTSSARQLNLSAALLGLSVLTDAGVEHYRGSFRNRAMYVPLVSAALTLGASLMGAADPAPKSNRVRDAVYALAAVTGLAGLGFHAYNISKRPGGWSWLNLFYAAPVGAPGALVLAGLLGGASEWLRECDPHDAQRVGRLLAAISAGGFAGNVAEVGLLHFRGAYQHPAMFLPVSVPPVAAALLTRAALKPPQRDGLLTRTWLKLTALLGLVGIGFHARGVSRNMGGWRNWSQNILNGPPLPAPPSFTALAIAGLAALALLKDRPHD
ncbi:MAG: hypothetical protein JSR66_26965 [Proteobacteria bacterium]|nr:hypothetical protein [Pseudomonadota bacterium]